MKAFLVFFMLATSVGIKIGQAQLVAQGSAISSADRPADRKEILEAKILENGTDHRIWQLKTAQANGDGQITQRIHSYVELATGLNFRNERGEYVASDPEIIVTATGEGRAQKAQHSIRFQPNINTAGAIDLTTPAGNHLRSHVIAVYLYDWKRNQRIGIAALQDSVGTVIGKDQVIYENALAGNGTRADVRYTTRKSGMSQDVIFRELVSAKELLLSMDTLEIEVWTEFLDFPQPTKSSREDTATGLIDDRTLDFGDMQIIPGAAFAAGDMEQRLEETPVKKRWVTLQGRTFLIESVSYETVSSHMARLPGRPQAQNLKRKNTNSMIALNESVPPARLEVKTSASEKLQVASISPTREGFVLDYETLNGSISNFAFESGATYFVSGLVTLSGNTVIEAGACIKFASGTTPKIQILGSVVCDTTQDRPAIFTAKDDDSVGEPIAGSTGVPSGKYGNGVTISASGAALHDLRFFHANSALRLDFSEGQIDLARLQVINCLYGVDFNGNSENTVNLNNSLFSGLTNVTTSGYDNFLRGSYLTVAQCYKLFVVGNGNHNGEVYLTNSIFANLYQLGSADLFAGKNNGFFNSPQFGTVKTIASASPFQSGAGGDFYLTNNSSFHDAGTTAIASQLLTEISQQTTYAPPVSTVDTNQPDLGFHYPVLTDFDLDGMEDGWEWLHFGSTAQTATGDYDGDGVSNLQEYLNGSDPNDIRFFIELVEDHINASPAGVEVTVTAGVPARVAVLVDSTNFPAATWSNYTSSNLTVSVGSMEGWHEVCVSLMGLSEDGPRIWQCRRLKLDATPPILVVTNPTPYTVSQPMIQLQGYSTEPLSRIYYDITNATGLLTNQQILVLDQYFDTNIFEFTTNTFQGFDIELTNGLNTITIYATDLAGNITNITVNFTLDYSGDTNPPVIQLYSPQNGALLSGDSFTWRGRVDDFTARLTLQTVDMNGATNFVTGLVERDGNFWFEDLPLENGTNVLILTAIDAAGNLSTTNISVFKSVVNLSVDPLTEDPWQDRVTVTGTIDSTAHTVWVNGVKATINGDGTWRAENVPSPEGGTSVIEARAIPNSDNGGNGTGGSGGSASSYQNTGNPSSSSAIASTATPEKEPTIRLMMEQKHHELDIDDWIYDTTQKSETDYHWVRDVEAVEHFHIVYHDPGDDFETTTTTTWSACSCEDGTAVSVGTHNGQPTSSTRSDLPPQIHLAARGERKGKIYYVVFRHEEKESRDAKMVLFTGGKGASTRRNLFTVTANAIEYMDIFDGDKSRGVPSENITVGELGQLGNDGNRYVVLPDNVTKDVTVRAKKAGYYTFGVGAGKHKLRIVVNGTCPLQPDRLVTCATNYWVGQRLEFTPMWIPALSGIASKIVQWEFGGNFVNDTWQRFIVVGTDPIIIDYYGAVTYSNNPALLTQENTHAWWVSGDQEYHAHIGQHLTFNNGQQVAVTEMGKFKMQRPRLISKNMCQDLSELNLPFDVPIRECLFVSETSGGVSLGEFNGGYARFWASFLSRPGDKFVETQIVNSYRQWGANAPLDSGTNWWFDGEGEKFGGKSLAGEDGVGIIQQTDKYPRIPKDEPEYHLRDIFKTYMRYRPQEAGSIFVTLGRVDWSWSVDGQFANGQWSDPAPGSISAPTWHEDEGFPDWIADTPNPQ